MSEYCTVCHEEPDVELRECDECGMGVCEICYGDPTLTVCRSCEARLTERERRDDQ